MDKKIIQEYLKNNTRIKLNLKNGFFYQGYITSIENNTVIFRDKFDTIIPIELDSISYVIPVGNRGGKDGN